MRINVDLKYRITAKKLFQKKHFNSVAHRMYSRWDVLSSGNWVIYKIGARYLNKDAPSALGVSFYRYASDTATI